MTPRKRSGPRNTGSRPLTSPPQQVPSRVRAGRELAAWEDAVLHLHAARLPAAVPPFAYRWLRRRGIRADWISIGALPPPCTVPYGRIDTHQKGA